MNFFKKMLPKSMKNFIKKMLGIKKPEKIFPGSKKYWEQRYSSNKNSGSGSYGRLASFKAEVLNNFVIDKEIRLVIELGSGDGNQLALASYPRYKGFDVSETAVTLCREKFKKDDSKEFFLMDDSSQKKAQAPLVLSLDVLYHLIEDSVFDNYMHRLFNMSSKYVIIYSSNYNDHFAPHVKCREFTEWIKAKIDDKWKLIEVIKNRYPFDAKDPDNTSMADFYIYQKQ